MSNSQVVATYDADSNLSRAPISAGPVDLIDLDFQLPDARRAVLSYPKDAWRITLHGPEEVLTLWKVVLGDGSQAPVPVKVCSGVPIVLGEQVDARSRRKLQRVQLAVITGRGKSLQVELSSVDAGYLNAPRELPRELAKFGIRSTDGVALCSWLHTIEAYNAMQTWAVSQHCGWFEPRETGGNTRTFIAPTWQVGHPMMHDLSKAAETEGLKFYQPSEHGTLQEWCAELRKHDMARFPLFGAELAATVGAVLCEPVTAAPAYTLESVAQRQQGKTELARLVQSFFGKAGKSGVEFGMNTTKGGMTAAATYLRCLPLFADDETAKQEGERDVSAVWLAYNVANGAGRLYSDPEMRVKQQGSWKPVALVTAEAPMLRDTKAAGAIARCFTVSAHPFSQWRGGKFVPPANNDYVINHIGPLRRFTDAVYGHGLRALAEAALSLTPDALTDMYTTAVSEIAEKLKGHSIVYTVARQIGVMSMGIWALRDLMKLDLTGILDPAAVIDSMVYAAMERDREGTTNDPWLQAWEAFLEWCANNYPGKIIDADTSAGAGAWRSGSDIYGVWESAGACESASSDITEYLSGVVTAAVTAHRGDLHLSVTGLQSFLAAWRGPLSQQQLLTEWGARGILIVRQTEAEREAKIRAGKKPDATPWTYRKRVPRAGTTITCYTVRGVFLRREEIPR